MAMQRTNILRDIDEDLAAGRVYVARETVLRFGGLRPGAREGLLRDQIARADALYERGCAGCPARQGRPAVAAAAAMYREILRQIERDGYGARPGRAVVPRRRKLVVAARAGDWRALARGYASPDAGVPACLWRRRLLARGGALALLAVVVVLPGRAAARSPRLRRATRPRPRRPGRPSCRRAAAACCPSTASSRSTARRRTTSWARSASAARPRRRASSPSKPSRTRPTTARCCRRSS